MESVRMGTQNGAIGTTAAWGRVEAAAIDLSSRRLQERKQDWAWLPIS